MKRIIKKILDFTVILDILLLICIICVTFYNSIDAYYGFDGCFGFTCKELIHYVGWKGIFVSFFEDFFYLFFVFSVSGLNILLLLPLGTYLNLKIHKHERRGIYLVVPIILPFVLLLLGLIMPIFKLFALFTIIYGIAFIISFFISLLYEKIFDEE